MGYWLVVAGAILVLLALGWRHDRKRRGQLVYPGEHNGSQYASPGYVSGGGGVPDAGGDGGGGT